MVSVFIGVWRDHSLGSVLGHTITVSTRSGDYLIAALSLFVTFAGNSLWSLVAFGLHQYNVDRRNADLLHRQFQVEYRNTTSAASTVWSFMKLAIAWVARDTSVRKRAAMRTLPPLLIGILFTAASVLVSEVATPRYGTSDVLISPTVCGLPDYPAYDAITQSAQNISILERRSALIQSSRAYARTCYANSSQLNECAMFTVPKLSPTKQTADCPFNDSTCISDAIRVSSGWLDSDRHLGINSPTNEALKMQYNLTCAVVDVKSFIKAFDEPDDFMSMVSVGPVTDAGVYTFAYSTNAWKEGIGYKLFSIWTSPSWTPIPQFDRNDSDTALFFLTSNSVSYLSPVTDPWFDAPTSTTGNKPVSNTLSFYTPSSNISVLGCIEQFQICNPSSRCTVIGGRSHTETTAAPLRLEPYQSIVFDRLLDAIDQGRVPGVVKTLGTASLLAQDTIVTEAFVDQVDGNKVIGFGLPPDQWQREVFGWFNTSLATIQQAIVNYVNLPAVLPPDTSFKQYNISKELEKAADRQCHNQRVKMTPQYQTFSLFGVLLLICIGSIIIILDMSLGTILSHLRARWGSKRSKARAEAAIGDQLLHLHGQMLGLEDLEIGLFDVPISKRKSRRKPQAKITVAEQESASTTQSTLETTTIELGSQPLVEMEPQAEVEMEPQGLVEMEAKSLAQRNRNRWWRWNRNRG